MGSLARNWMSGFGLRWAEFGFRGGMVWARVYGFLHDGFVKRVGLLHEKEVCTVLRDACLVGSDKTRIVS